MPAFSRLVRLSQDHETQRHPDTSKERWNLVYGPDFARLLTNLRHCKCKGRGLVQILCLRFKDF